MKSSTRTSTLAVSFLVLSTTAFAGGSSDNIPGTGGVVVDFEDTSLVPVVVDSVDAAHSEGVAVAIPNIELEQAKVTTKATTVQTKSAPLPVALIEAAAEEETGDAAFKAIVKAMKPREPVKPLEGKRVSVYLSEKVAFAQYETSATRFKVKNGRAHVATLYSEQRDSVLHGGLALDASFASSFRLSFGTRAYIALLNTENTDAFAAAVGVEAAYNLPFKALPLEFAASIYYAPDILTFGASDRAVDAQIDFAFPLRAQSSLFAGARFLQVDTRPEDREIDNRVHMGIRWDFM